MENNRKTVFKEIASEVAELTPTEAAKVQGFIAGIKTTSTKQQSAPEPEKAS